MEWFKRAKLECLDQKYLFCVFYLAEYGGLHPPLFKGFFCHVFLAVVGVTPHLNVKNAKYRVTKMNQKMGQNNQKDQKGHKMTTAVIFAQDTPQKKKWSPHISLKILKVRFFWDTL